MFNYLPLTTEEGIHIAIYIIYSNYFNDIYTIFKYQPISFLAAKQQLYNLESWLIHWFTDSPLALELVIPLDKTPMIVKDGPR